MQTTENKTRRKIGLIIIIILAVFAGFFDFPKPWDAAANWLRTTAGIPVFNFPSKPYRLGLDIIGGTHLIAEADMSNVLEGDRDEALSGVRDVIERRVNAYGVAEPVVQTARVGDSWRVNIELAGVKDIKEAIKLIGDLPVLEFREEGIGEQRVLTDEERKEMESYNAEAKKKADEVLKKVLASGADFDALLSEFSEGEEKKDSKGDIGFLGLTPQFDKIVLALDRSGIVPNKVLNYLVENDLGWNIVKYSERRVGERKVRASHILICFAGAQSCNTSTSKEIGRKLAVDLKQKLTAGNFSNMAWQNSEDSSAKINKGDLGYFSKEMMVKEFSNAVFAQKTGTIIGPIESPFGFHLIYKTDDRMENQYKVQRIFIKKKTSESIAPPSPWRATGLGGKQLKRASVQFDPTSGEPQVSLEFNDEGKRMFADITSRNVDKFVAIFLDGQPISIPRVVQPITGGQAVITGTFTLPEAKQLRERLNAGALPVPIHIISQVSVGATLGQDSLARSLKAGLIGFALVALFMIFYYRFAGVIAVLALFIYTIFVLAIFKVIPVTLTLAGIAGFIITLGMAVDGNVLIFARLKEELRAGKSLLQAIEEGFTRSWPSIRDGHITTLISAVILFWFSSSVIKGFALTLFIGVAFSLFSSVVVSRILMRTFAAWIKNPRIWIGFKN